MESVAEEYDISLMICTRNRADALRNQLASITAAASALDPARLQIVVVNNNSTDDTAAVVAAWVTQQPFRVEQVLECKLGLAAARNAALRRTQGAIIAMSDDDCVLPADYFARLAAAFATRPGPCIVGGRVLLGDERDLPITIRVATDKAMLGRQFPGGFLIGANMAFSAAAVARIGPFDERFGAGAPLRAAEETDWLLRATALNVPVHFEPDLVLTHFHGRRGRADALKLYAGYYAGNGGLYAKHLLSNRRVARSVAGDLYRAIRDLVRPEPFDLLGIRRRHLFKLRHEFEGFIAYARGRTARSG